MTDHQTIAPDCLVVQQPGNIVSDMGGEKVMLNVEQGKYYNLGVIGGRIWELMAEPVTVARVVELLTAEYEVERQECEEQVVSFIGNLRKEGLVSVDEAPVNRG